MDDRKGIKVDITRHLCTTCKKQDLTCENKWYDQGENGNIFRCKKHTKIKETSYRWRADEGNEYFSYIIKDDKVSMKQFKPNRRIENKSYTDNLYHEVGNYFRTEEECIINYKQFEKIKFMQNEEEKTIEQLDVDFNQESIDQQSEDYAAYQIWLGQEGNASKENLDQYYEWLNSGGYEVVFNSMLNEQ